MKSKQVPFYWLTVALFFGIISPNLLSDGMFLDGVTYAAISKNLAHGLGTFWNLHFTNTLDNHFYGHPPLAFGLQSLFFRVFGDGYLTERIYSLSTYLVTGFVIVRIWKKTVAAEINSLAWLPLLFWISVPLATWGASNNVLEDSMMVFISLSVLFTVKSYERNRFINIVVSGIMLFLAILTKGPVGLFSLALPFWMYVFKRDVTFKRFVTDTSILIMAVVSSFVLMFLIFPESVQNLTAYFNRQIVASFTTIQTVNSRFSILGRLLSELIPMAILVVLILLITRKIKTVKSDITPASIFLFLGLSGAVPIMVSLKQSGFYIIPVFPFFALAAASWIAPKILPLIHKINVNSKRFKIFRYTAYGLFLLSMILNVIQINKTGRDTKMLEDVYSISGIIPEATTVSIDSTLNDDWLIISYLARYDNISLDARTPFHHNFALVRKDYNGNLLMNYKHDSVRLNLYRLYQITPGM